jgi:hypothetical protein
MVEQNIRAANNFDNYLRNESLSIIKYLDSLALTPTVTTSQGDIAVLSRSSFVIKNKRRLISLLDSSKDFTKLEGKGLYDMIGSKYYTEINLKRKCIKKTNIKTKKIYFTTIRSASSSKYNLMGTAKR